jgi:hypothetical protein
VYLLILGVADRVFHAGNQGSYVFHDTDWRHSATCKAAGFLCLLSSEVSAFIVCLITFDR